MMKQILAAAIALVMVSAAVYADSGHDRMNSKKPSHSGMKGPAPAAASGTAQTTCPVMKGGIDRNRFAEYDGRRVYFCCPNCKARFDQDPAKYVKKLEKSGVVLEKTQTVCPVMGGKIVKKQYSDYQGQRVYFCCPNCKARFNKDPEKYMKKIADSKVVLQSVQKTCPVTGKPVDRNNYVDYRGRRVYFSSPGCVETFNKDPEKYLKKLGSGGGMDMKSAMPAVPGEKDQQR